MSAIFVAYFTIFAQDMINQFENVDQLSQLIDDANQVVNLFIFVILHQRGSH